MARQYGELLGYGRDKRIPVPHAENFMGSLYKKAEDSGALDIGTSNLMPAIGVAGFSSLGQSLKMRSQEIDQVYASMWSQMDAIRYLCKKTPKPVSEILPPPLPSLALPKSPAILEEISVNPITFVNIIEKKKMVSLLWAEITPTYKWALTSSTGPATSWKTLKKSSINFKRTKNRNGKLLYFHIMAIDENGNMSDVNVFDIQF